MPDLYFEARDSLDNTKDVATSARAMLVPDTADEMSSVIAEEGLGGRLLLVGSGGGTFLLPSALSSAEDCTLIFALVELFGILMGDGVGFRMECAALCGRVLAPKQAHIARHADAFRYVLEVARVLHGCVDLQAVWLAVALSRIVLNRKDWTYLQWLFPYSVILGPWAARSGSGTASFCNILSSVR